MAVGVIYINYIKLIYLHATILITVIRAVIIDIYATGSVCIYCKAVILGASNIAEVGQTSF